MLLPAPSQRAGSSVADWRQASDADEVKANGPRNGVGASPRGGVEASGGSCVKRVKTPGFVIVQRRPHGVQH